jgi:hypothetical protein
MVFAPIPLHPVRVKAANAAAASPRGEGTGSRSRPSHPPAAPVALRTCRAAFGACAVAGGLLHEPVRLGPVKKRARGYPGAMNTDDSHSSDDHTPEPRPSDDATDEALRELAELHREDDTQDPAEQEQGVGDPLTTSRNANRRASPQVPSD